MEILETHRCNTSRPKRPPPVPPKPASVFGSIRVHSTIYANSVSVLPPWPSSPSTPPRKFNPEQTADEMECNPELNPECTSDDSTSTTTTQKSYLKSIVLVQSIVHMWVMRRRYKATLKTFRVRCEVVKEVLSSEKRYNKQLHAMIEVFLKPLRDTLQRRDDPDSDSDSEGVDENDTTNREARTYPDYSEDDIFQIFSHLEIVYNLSNVLIGLLEERYAHGWRTHRTLGDVFIQIGPYLKTLKQYVENYDNALVTLRRLKDDSDGFTEMIDEMKSDPRCLALDLAALLIVPVQRVPRYILLLDTLKHNTPEDHADYALLTQAISELKRVASFINEGIGSDKDLPVLAYLQGLADTQGIPNVELIKTHRKMLKHGVVTKKSMRDSGCSQRELYLLTDILVVVADYMNVAALRRIDNIVPLVTTTLIDNNISNGADSIIYMNVKEEWMSTIRTAISDLLQAHPNNHTLRKQWSVDFRNNEWRVIHAAQLNNADKNELGGMAQLAQLQKLLTLNNRGKIRIKNECVGRVEEVLGPFLQLRDKCNHYAHDGTFLVFPPSERILWLIHTTGYITLVNKSFTVARLAAHLRGCGVDRRGRHYLGKFYDLLPGESKQGHWTIEVISGDCAGLRVVRYSASSGDGLPNLLGMVRDR